MALIVCSQLLVPDGSSTLGRTLRLSYQLRDETGRTAVQTEGVTLRPLLSYAGNATAIELPACDGAGADAVSGIGECAVTVDAAKFPAAGVAAATAVLQLRIG